MKHVALIKAIREATALTGKVYFFDQLSERSARLCTTPNTEGVFPISDCEAIAHLLLDECVVYFQLSQRKDHEELVILTEEAGWTVVTYTGMAGEMRHLEEACS